MTTPATILISRPTAQFTTNGHAHIQFEWWSSASPNERTKGSYGTPQAELAALAPPRIEGLAAEHPELAGFWSDDEVEGHVIARLQRLYGFTNIAIEPDPAQPDVPVAKTTLEKAQQNAAA